MIEIVLGALLVAAALAVLFGAGGLVPGLPAGFDPLPILGLGGTAVIILLGAALIADGVVRRAMAREPERRPALLSARLAGMGCAAVGGLAVGAPLVAEPFNLVRIEAIPAGFYLAAQGAPVGLVVLAFVWAARAARIEGRKRSHD